MPKLQSHRVTRTHGPDLGPTQNDLPEVTDQAESRRSRGALLNTCQVAGTTAGTGMISSFTDRPPSVGPSVCR